MTLADAFDPGPAFIPYLAAGDPSAAATEAYVRALVRGGADVIELGLPFSEPIAEGPTIQDAVARSLAAGMTPDGYFELVEALDLDVPVVCMTYYNLLFRYGQTAGPRSFVDRAAEAGVDGFVIPDLPAEEAGPLRQACDDVGLDLVFIVAPTTTDDRLATIMDQVSGYVYVQARLGTTGTRADVSERTARCIARVADHDSDMPAAVGFGIAEAEHAREVVSAGADGVIVGSALVDIVAQGGEDVSGTAERLEARARELSAGARAGAHPERT